MDEFKEEVKGKKFNITVWMISSLVIFLLLIVSIFTHGFGIKSITGATTKDIQETVKKYIEDYMVPPGTSVEIGEFKEENGLYNFPIKVMGKEYTFYASIDGKFLFPGGYDITKEINLSGSNTQQEIPKQNKPKVELFVMSFCPYGNKAEDTMLSVYDLLKDNVEWGIHYIVSISGDSVSSLHGQAEVDEDEREACVLNEDGLDKWWKFVSYVNKNCGSKGECWEEAAKDSGLDVNKIETCVKEKGLKLMKNDESLTSDLGVSGSPTLIINDVESSAVYQYGDSEAYKTAICNAFTKEPEECSKKLTSATTATTSSGSCS